MKNKLSKEQRDLKKAKAFYASCPFTTKIYMCFNTKLSLDFVTHNWQAITSKNLTNDLPTS